MAPNPNHRIVVIYEGPKVGQMPDIAGEIVRNLVAESARQGEQGRFRVQSVTIGTNAVALRLELNEEQLAREKQYLHEAKMIFGAIAADTYTRKKGFKFG